MKKLITTLSVVCVFAAPFVSCTEKTTVMHDKEVPVVHHEVHHDTPPIVPKVEFKVKSDDTGIDVNVENN